MSYLYSLINDPLWRKIIFLSIGIVIILLVTIFLRMLINKRVEKTDQKYRARKAVTFLTYILVIVTALFIFSEQLDNLGMIVGVAGAGIAFALQEVIVSFAGWVNIILNGTVKVSDRVKIDDVKGDIIDIGILTTTIMEIGDWVDGDLYNGRIITIANSYIFKQKIHNYSHEYPFLWDEMKIPIRHGSDYQKTKEVFQEILESICGEYAKNSKKNWNELSNKYNVEPAQVEPMVSMSFDQSWMVFTLRYIVDYKKRRSTKFEISNQILSIIKDSSLNIRIAASALEVTNYQGDLKK